MRRGLKLLDQMWESEAKLFAARAAPYEKGTETEHDGPAAGLLRSAARAAPYEKGTETILRLPEPTTEGLGRARGPL